MPVFSETKGNSALDFIPPETAIARPHTVGGDPCNCMKDMQEETPLTPLIPKLSNLSKSIQSNKSDCLSLPSSASHLLKRCNPDLEGNPHRGGLTSNAIPSFFVYVPNTTATVGDFLLLEHLENGGIKELHHHEFPLPVESGIVRIPSPIALEEGKTYEWHFAIICNSENPRQWADRGTDVVAVGMVKRISLPSQLRNRLDRGGAIAKLEIYGEAGLWYDFFALLAENQPQSPILREAWRIILTGEFGQESPIPQAPILPCCSTIARDN